MTATPAEAKVLLVDDDSQILAFVSRQLRSQGYRVDLARNGQEALDRAAELPPDLVILDLYMPVLDGVETLRQFREWSDVPVIVLSARNEEQRKVEALDLGADDYLTKPFSVAELLARVRAALRRRQRAREPFHQEQELRLPGDVSIDLRRRQVSRAGSEVLLTRTEYELLHCLAVNAGKVVTHRQLLQEVWGPEYGEETEYLRTFIKQLRRKLEDDPARPRLVLTQPGVGYRLAVTT
ncbi:MAG: response regulator transcription factor [Chloroflexi bacterium]|nr:response regulator transcription factor [Chloroflexota bacterium]